MLFSLLGRTLYATFSMACLFLVAYNLMPHLVLRVPVMLVLSLLYGGYVWYVHYSQSVAINTRLQFVPTGNALAVFQEQIKQCSMDPEKVSLRYGYAGDGVAMANYQTVIIDPILWQDCQQDAAAQAAIQVLQQFVLPGLAQDKKELNERIKLIITPAAQRFIFKHELGHVYYNYSFKKLLFLGATGFTVTVAGLTSAALLLPAAGGMVAFVCGTLVAWLTDIIITYSSNVLFKAREERNADLFAAQHSTPEEIEAAALFFEHYEKSAQQYRTEHAGLLKYVPGIVLSGHPDGITRGAYLRKLIS